MQPTGNIVLQDTFVFDVLRSSMNQKGVLFNEPLQDLSIRDITNVAYLPEGRGRVFHLERKVH